VHGYGVIQRRWGDPPRHTYLRMHVSTWEECFGPVPEGLRVLHKCDVRACRQPLHLWTGTQKQNNQDRNLKGRTRNRNSDKTECVAGHPLDPLNTYITPDGRRNCRMCARRRSQVYEVSRPSRRRTHERRPAS
jgi:hypothetical protein